jgi:polyphosphate kinase
MNAEIVTRPPAPAGPAPEQPAPPALYVHRELSLLTFFERVLAMAERDEIPPLERVRFLTISSSILDEFFEIRVASLKQRAQLGIYKQSPDGLTALEALRRINTRVQAFVKRQYQVFNDELLPALGEIGVQVIKRDKWTKLQKRWIKKHFEEQVLPVLTPVGLDPAHPFPRILNKALNMFVALDGTDAFGRASEYAVLPVPRCLPRVIALPDDVGGGAHTFVLLSSVIHAHVGEVFPGMKVTGCHQFRVTRNGDLWVDEEEVEDLLDALKGRLDGRRFADAVRLEVARSCPREHIDFLVEHFHLQSHELYRVDGPVNLHRLVAIYDLVDRPELTFPTFSPAVRTSGDLFETIQRGDVLLHHPYESFAPVVDFVRQAASDPDVLAIKQTVYRTSSRSPIIQALLKAARAGKEVTAVIELRARFDEAHNIGVATRLQEAGAHVVYGVVGYKTHAKMMLVVRREAGKLRRYVHLGTGNYHSGTARAYTDFGLMTCDETISKDVHSMFIQLTGLGRGAKLKAMLQSPFSLKDTLLEKIAFEATEARAGRTARIIVKLNSLNEPKVMAALVAASQAGVQVDLIIRGVCCLRPGVPGYTDNIRIRSVLGRFLEHTRVYYFYAGGEEDVYLASADWMNRNLNRRVESCFPVRNPQLKAQVIGDGLKVYLKDTAGAWEMGPDGEYTRVLPEGDAPAFSAQSDLLKRLR